MHRNYLSGDSVTLGPKNGDEFLHYICGASSFAGDHINLVWRIHGCG